MKYFTLRELCASQTAGRLRIDNTPSAEALRNLARLTDRLLDPIREAWGRPLIVTSGYRSPELNKVVGGVANSQHLQGLAADLITPGNNRLQNYQLYLFIKDRFDYDQLLAEHCKNNGCEWLHISIPALGHTPRNQSLLR